MVKIRITRGGCGISYKDANGTPRHTCKTAESGAFECDDAQADRLVRLGVAAYVSESTEPQEKPDESAAEDSKAEPHEGSQEAETATAHLDAAELETMDYNELKKLAADMGAEPKSQKKADLIAAITAIGVTPGDEDTDALPALDAADPV